jgi:TRAP transporter TAXI family solute receptor
MPRGLRIGCCLWLAALLAFGASARAAEKFITIGTGSELGVYYPTGGAICRLVKRGIQNHGIRCFVEASNGSIDNLNSLRKGEEDTALVQSDWAYAAYNGKGIFAPQGPNHKLRLIFSLYPEAFTVMVRADSPVKRFRDLRGMRINLSSNGSGAHPLMEKLMKLEGWNEQSFRSLSDIKPSQQAKALCENRVDAIVYVTGNPNGAVEEAALQCATRIIPVTGPEIDRLVAASPYYYHITIPAGMYRGTPRAVKTFGVKALLLASSDMDDNTAYFITKAVFDNLDNFKTLHPVFATLDSRKMMQDVIGIPLHPGAVRYYREAGLLSPSP